MTELVIDRKVWLRGEGGEKSLLLRPEDGKMCCLGIYLKQCGMPDSLLRGRANPTQLTTAPTWLRAAGQFGGFTETAECRFLILQNDDERISEPAREQRIAEGFAKAGVSVRFEG